MTANPPSTPIGSAQPAHTLQWLTAGWQVFLAHPGIWIAQTAILIAILAALGFVPLLGWAAAPVALPMLAAGMLAGVDAHRRQGIVRVDHLFEGLRRRTRELLLLGLCHLAGALVAALIATLIGGSAVLTGMLIGALAGVGLAAGGVMFGVLVFTVLWTLLIMALCFAPALVLLGNMPPLEAMKLSARACFANPLTFIVLAAMLYVLVWIAMLPAGLGMLVLVPVIMGALHAAWVQLFNPAPALPAPDHKPENPVDAS